jgi:inosine-uridine nucleoside N-ribohydrolase
VDDVLAMLLAFSAKREELEVLMLSVTFGNVDVQRWVVFLDFLSAQYRFCHTELHTMYVY